MTKRAAIISITIVLILGTSILYFLLGGKTPSGAPIFEGSPFGTPPDDATTVPSSPDDSATPSVGSDGRPLPGFVRLSGNPIAGAVGIIKRGSTFVRYVDRATGHIYDVSPSTLEKARIYNVTSPKIYEVLWRNEGTGYIARSVTETSDTVSNASLTLIPPSATSSQEFFTAQTALMRGNISDIAVLPNGNLVYSLPDTQSVVISNFTGGTPRTLFTSAFTEWDIKPISNASVLITTKPSEVALGYSYTLGTSNGALTKVLGPLTALSALPNEAGRIAYSYLNRGVGMLSIRLPSGSVVDITPTTLADKCTWSAKDASILICGVPKGGLGLGYPDAWYQGTLSFSDGIWRFNTDTRAAEILLDSEDIEVKIDVQKIFLSPDEDWLFFTNKEDLTLWGLKLTP